MIWKFNRDSIRSVCQIQHATTLRSAAPGFSRMNKKCYNSVMQGTVFIEDLVLLCHIGITPEERKKQQKIVVSVYMHSDMEKAAVTDDLNETVNYSTIRSQLLKMAQDSRFNLLEKLAAKIADICLSDCHVMNVKVIVKKPQRYEDVNAVGCVVEKER